MECFEAVLGQLRWNNRKSVAGSLDFAKKKASARVPFSFLHMAGFADVVYYPGMQRTYIWSLVAALLVVIVGIVVSVIYSSDTPLMTTTSDPQSSSTPTISIGKPRDDGSETILTPSLNALFGGGQSTTTLSIPEVAFRFVAPRAGETFVAGNSTAITLAFDNAKQQVLSMGFELRKADNDAYVASSSLPSIASAGGSLTPSVAWNIPHDLPAGKYYILGTVNRGPNQVKSPVFEITKNPLSLLVSANNMYRQVVVRDRGESVDVHWTTTGAKTCTVGINGQLERNLPSNGKKLIYVVPGDTIMVSCQDGTYSAMERISVVKK